MQEETIGNWWLIVKENVEVGYWPKEIFSHLQKGATNLHYGGWVFISPDGNSPPMGSGHFPNDDSSKSCYFRDMKFDDITFQESELLDNRVQTYHDTKCYNVLYWNHQLGDTWGKAITFGGPGGHCGT